MPPRKITNRIRIDSPLEAQADLIRIGGVDISIASLAESIYDTAKYLRTNFSRRDLVQVGYLGTDFVGTDVRIRVYGENWYYMTGDSQYDQDHRGAWGVSSIPYDCKKKEARAIAMELIRECEESFAMGEE